MSENVEDSNCPKCAENFEKMHKEMADLTYAGNDLAEAAVHVVCHYDGIHRLSKAISRWFLAVANQNGRGKERSE